MTVWQSVRLFPAPGIASAWLAWWQAVSETQPSEDITFFAMFLTFAAWVIGFVSIWFILRRRNPWVAVSLSTIMVLVNLTNLPREYHYILPFYLFAAIVLVGQSSLAKQVDWFRKMGSRYSYRAAGYFTSAVFTIGILSVSAAWFVPEVPLDKIGLRINTSAAQEKDDDAPWFNIFANVPSKWSVIDSAEQQTLPFSKPIVTSDRILFIIDSYRPVYWRTRRYDTYNSWGWTSSITTTQALNPGRTVNSDDYLTERDVLRYTVENRLKTDVIVTGGELELINIPVVLQVFPADIPASPSEPNAETQNSNIESQAGDIVTVVSRRMMGPYQRYMVVTDIASASPGQLLKAGDNYPSEITNHYLQLPDTLPEQVILLSQEITTEMATPYQKAIAIKYFLGNFKYNIASKAYPEEVDGVDYFLFSELEGFCTNFASAMVVMLRSVGVPARLSTGYRQVEADEITGSYIIRSQHYHAWAEVYFPGYGWIEFETTPLSAPDSAPGTAATIANILSEDEELLLPEEETGALGPLGGTSAPATRRPGLPGPELYVYFIVTGTLFLTAFAIRLLFHQWHRRLKKIETPTEAYDRMCYLASLGRSGPAAHETPLEYSARLTMILPAQAEDIDIITQAYLRTTYSPRKEVGEPEKSVLQKSWVQLSPFLLKHLLRLRRWLIVRMVRPLS